MRTLTIISHTEHYTAADGRLVGLGATVMEINHLLTVFDTIYHVAMLYDSTAPAHSLPYASDKVVFIPIPAVGGRSLKDKVAIVWQAPTILKRIRYALSKTDYFQFRAPTGIGVFVVPYLVYLYRGKGWFKYAGDWAAKQSPMAYRFQNYLLKHQSRTVTINGQWPEQPAHCITFENPCLTADDLACGRTVVAEKQFPQHGVTLCFVGRLEAEKGLDLFLEALALLAPSERLKIKAVHIIGGGSRMATYKEEAKDLEMPILFHGVLSRTAVHNIYKISHGIVLPSQSEGFPKVIAEAMNYGCLPMVSDISAIGDYVINAVNGFLFSTLTPKDVQAVLNTFLHLSPEAYRNMVKDTMGVVDKFSYASYHDHLERTVLQ